MTKEEVRAEVREQKRKLSSSEIQKHSNAALQQITSMLSYKEAEEVYTYVSYNQEISTIELIQKAILDGKKVAVPVVEGKEIEFYYIRSLEDLHPGYQGIPEPAASEKAILKDGTLMLLPGLAFSKAGERIGYGGGFYDRYLCRHTECSILKCGFAYEFQVYERLVTESFDQAIDFVVTPKNIYDCHKNDE